MISPSAKDNFLLPNEREHVDLLNVFRSKIDFEASLFNAAANSTP